jgi:hypothetical protein
MIVDSAQNSFCDSARIVFFSQVFCPETDEAASPARRSGFYVSDPHIPKPGAGQ